MRKNDAEAMQRKMSGQRCCRLCGEPFPLEGIERVDSCYQWSNYILRNLPNPGDVTAILVLSLITKLCTLQTVINRSVTAMESIADIEDGR
jgi:hypothetical protein